MALGVRFSIHLFAASAGILILSGAALTAADKGSAKKDGAETPSRSRRWEYPVERKPVRQIALDRVQLPPLPEGVEELKFAEFFKMPVGPRGLELTERALALN